MLSLEYLAEVEDEDPATAAMVQATLALIDEIRDVPNRVPPSPVPLVWTQGWTEVRSDQDLPKTAGTAIAARDESGSYRCWELLIVKGKGEGWEQLWRTIDDPVRVLLLESMVASTKRFKLLTAFSPSPPTTRRKW